MRPTKLPGWVVSNESSVRHEAAPYRDMTPEARLAVLRLVSRSAARQVATHPNAERIRRFQDPLPTSTIVALARLRKQAGWGAL